MTNAYEREVRRYLLEEYGAKNLAVVNGGKHPRLMFEYEGRAHTITLQRQPGGHKLGASTINMKLRDIRRLLGPPKKEKTMSVIALPTITPELTPELAKAPPTTYRGVVGHYLGGSAGDQTRCRVFFGISAELYARFGHAAGVSIKYLGDYTWELRPHPNNKTPAFTNRERSLWALQSEPLAVPLPAFGRTPAEFVLVDGAIMVRVDPVALRSVRGQSVTHGAERGRSEPLRGLGLGLGFGSGPDQPTTVSDAVEPTPEASGVTHDEVRRVLEAVRRIERMTVYRLVRVKRPDGEVWAFSAPRIE